MREANPDRVTYSTALQDAARQKKLKLITIDKPGLQLQLAVTDTQAKALQRLSLNIILNNSLAAFS